MGKRLKVDPALLPGKMSHKSTYMHIYILLLVVSSVVAGKPTVVSTPHAPAPIVDVQANATSAAAVVERWASGRDAEEEDYISDESNGHVVSRSRFHAEGQAVFSKFFQVTRHASNGICRAVNVTGNTAAFITGSLFKLVGAAVMDAGTGLEEATQVTTPLTPVLDSGVRLTVRALRDTGTFVYRLGEVTENVTAEAVVFAEDAVRYLIESAIDNVEQSTNLLMQVDGAGSNGELDYFSDKDAVIVEHMIAEEGVRVGGKATESIKDGISFGIDTDRRWGTDGKLIHADKHRRKERGWRRRLRQSMATAGAVPSMRAQSLLACVGVLAVRCITTSPYYAALSLVAARVYLRAVEGVYREAVGDQIMDEIRYEALARYQSGTPERARWLNTIIEQMWNPVLEHSLSSLIQYRLNLSMGAALPSNVTWIGITKFTLGKKAPRFHYVMVLNYNQLKAQKKLNNMAKALLADARDPNKGINPDDILYVEAGLDFASLDSKVTLKVGMPKEKRRHWWSVSTYVPSYRVKVSALQLQAKVAMGFHLRDGPPYVRRVWLTFEEVPRVRFAVEAVKGMDISGAPILRQALRNALLRGLAPLCEPRYISPEVLTEAEAELSQSIPQPPNVGTSAEEELEEDDDSDIESPNGLGRRMLGLRPNDTYK